MYNLRYKICILDCVFYNISCVYMNISFVLWNAQTGIENVLYRKYVFHNV